MDKSSELFLQSKCEEFDSLDTRRIFYFILTCTGYANIGTSVLKRAALRNHITRVPLPGFFMHG
jgi:hypothetical protein